MKKIFIHLLLFICPLLSFAEVEIDGIYYHLVGKGNWIAYVYGTSDWDYWNRYEQETIVIPETVKYDGLTYKVTRIDNYAFAECINLKSITIPNSVKSIEKSAFLRCSNLTNVTLSDNLISIAAGAFSDCYSLAHLTIPESLISVDEYAFDGCSKGLTSIVVDSSNSKYDSRDNCNALIETETNKLILGCQNTNIPASVTAIGYRAFFECNNLTSISLPANLISIEDGAFAHCYSLTNLAIPESLASIGKSAFWGCGESLTSIVVDSSNPNYDSRDNCNALIETETNKLILGCQNTTIPVSVTVIEEDAFACANLSSIVIPKNISEIGYTIFWRCDNLTSITVEADNNIFDSRNNCNAIIRTADNTLITGCRNTIIPSSVTTIGKYAFSGFHNLRSINIPDGVSRIEEEAFQYCYDLESIVIPSTTTYVGGSAFYGCDNLDDIYCYAETPCFDNWIELEDVTLHVPATSINSYKSTYGNNFKDIVDIEDDENNETVCQTLDLTIISPIGYGKVISVPMATNEGQPLTWTAEDSSIASINDGTLTALKVGTTTVTATQAGNNDYKPFSREFTLTVTKAALTITADDKTKDVGDENPELTVTYSGFVNGDDASSLTIQPTVTTTATASSPAGTYPITASGAASGNYDITYVDGTLTVADAYSQGNTLSGLDAKGLAGNQATLEIALTNADVVSLCQFDLRLPAGVTVALNSKNKLDATLSDRASTHRISSSQLANGDYRFLVSSLNGDAFTGNEGTLMTIVLDIAADAATGNKTVRVFDIELSLPVGSDLRTVNPADAESLLTISDYTPGDVNNDGKVSVTDVGYAINYILEQVPSVFIFDAADMNQDGKITVTDVGYIINLILSDNAGSRAAKPESTIQNAVQTGIATLEKAGTDHRFAIAAVGDYIGFQMDVTLPAGIDLSAARLNAMSNADHTLAMRQVADNKYRIVCYSMDNSPLSHAADALLTLYTSAPTDGISLSNILFTTTGLAEIPFAIGGVTGISGIGTADGTAPIYDMQGRRMDGTKSLHKGVYVSRETKSVIIR